MKGKIFDQTGLLGTCQFSGDSPPQAIKWNDDIYAPKGGIVEGSDELSYHKVDEVYNLSDSDFTPATAEEQRQVETA